MQTKSISRTRAAAGFNARTIIAELFRQVFNPAACVAMIATFAILIWLLIISGSSLRRIAFTALASLPWMIALLLPMALSTFYEKGGSR